MKNDTTAFFIFIIAISFFSFNYSAITLIDSPGVWPLGGPITANPQTPNDTIISIVNSNVIFDAHDFVINQESNNTMPGLIGIYIAPQLTNITIKNCTINGLSGPGIYIGDGCSKIYLENISIINCNQTGILVDGNLLGSKISDITITNCLISSCKGIDTNPVYGLHMIATKNATISNCTFNDNQTYLADNGYGINLENCYACEFNSCKSYDNGGNILGAGISIINSIGCSFIDCNANGNSALTQVTTSTSCGFFINSCTATLLSSCNALDNSNSKGSGIGFTSYNNLNSIFKNCMAANNLGGIVAAGFYFDANDSNFGINNNVAAANIATLENGKSFGILLNGAQGFLISNNTFASNLGAEGYGLVDTTINTNNLFTNNLSYNNTSTGYSITFTKGEFPVSFASNNNFSNLKKTSQYFNVAIVTN